jgi:hypothetical protein
MILNPTCTKKPEPSASQRLSCLAPSARIEYIVVPVSQLQSSLRGIHIGSWANFQNSLPGGSPLGSGVLYKRIELLAIVWLQPSHTSALP